MKTTETKIQELKEKLDKLTEKRETELIEKYQFLVGKYFMWNSCYYEKILNINEVYVATEEDEYDQVSYSCIDMYYSTDQENNSSISLDSYKCWVNAEDLEKHMITEEEFIDVFDKCVSSMKKIINEK